MYGAMAAGAMVPWCQDDIAVMAIMQPYSTSLLEPPPVQHT